MPVTKLNISLESSVASSLRRRAAEEGKTMSRYLTELILRDTRSRQEELAGEGYRLLGSQGLEFSERALPLVDEAWPSTGREQPQGPAGPGAVRERRARARKTASR